MGEVLALREGGHLMAFVEGEVYRCPDPDCGCEITVTKGAAPGHGGDEAPTCCCGLPMEKVH
jgi:hypothetical protein